MKSTRYESSPLGNRVNPVENHAIGLVHVADVPSHHPQQLVRVL